MARTVGATRLATLLGDFDRAPAYAGLADGLRALVNDGRLPAGVRLPSERELTGAVGVSRTTVARAYAALREEGLLHSRQGSGSVVTLPEGRARVSDHLLTPRHGLPDAIDLTCAAPSPHPGVLAAYRRAAEALPTHLSGTGYYPSGLAVLREAVAASYDARGLPTDPDQVVVVPGALAGVAVAARALLTPGDRVLTESPTYPNAIATLRRSGGRVLGAEPDADALAAALSEVLPRVAYLIPDFQNPTGTLLGDADRAALAATLRRTRTTAVVDESMAPLPLEGQPMPAPFAAHAPDTISVGSTSKQFWGGLRIGWMRVPARHLDAVVAARLSLDLGAPVLEQLVAADLLATGAPLLEERRAAVRVTRDATVAALAEHLPTWRLRVPRGGLMLWCELPAPLSTALAARAPEHGVVLAPGPAFAPEGGLDRFVRLPLTLQTDAVVEAVRRLADAWRETCAAPARRAPTTTPSPTLVA